MSGVPMIRLVQRFDENELGAVSLEYAAIVAGMLICIIYSLDFLKDKVFSVYDRATEIIAVQGRTGDQTAVRVIKQDEARAGDQANVRAIKQDNETSEFGMLIRHENSVD